MTRKSKVRGFLGSIATLTAIVGITAPANAITFTYGGLSDNGNSTITKTVDGLTLTIDQATDFTGDPVVFETGNTFEGLKLSNTTSVSPLPYSFKLTFDKDVRFVSYNVTNAESDGVGDFFNLTQGSVISNNNSVATVGTAFPFSNTTSVFQAGVPIMFTSGDILTGDPDDETDALPGVDEVFLLNNITVETAAVPFEFSPTLGLLAVGGIWGISRLRKRATANEVMNKLSA